MNKPFALVCFLLLTSLLPACAGTKERETERLLLLQSRYSGSIIRLGIKTENDKGGIGTAFYTGSQHGFITARHVLMQEDEEGNEYAAEQLMLHIPSCKTDYTANMGDAVEDKENDAMQWDTMQWKNDWANFMPTEDTLNRRPLRYDRNIELRNNRRVYIAGYPILERVPDYEDGTPVEWLSTINLFTYATKQKLMNSTKTKNRKFNTVFIPFLGDIDRFRGMSGGPVLIWDEDTQDFIAVGILVTAAISTHSGNPLLVFIRPQISPIELIE
ncbi:MAG: hypothetical protein JKY43_01635 [Phycisphaerales bacterium]|nr:hypothetical protein [Phycisphaerales bacterium]